MRRFFLLVLPCLALAALGGCARKDDNTTTQATAAPPAAPKIVKPKAEEPLSMPFYPPESRKAREEGSVELNLHVLADGSIDQVGILKSSGFPRLDEYAVREASTRWRLKPGTVDGEPTAMWHSLRVTFKLSE